MQHIFAQLAIERVAWSNGILAPSARQKKRLFSRMVLSSETVEDIKESTDRLIRGS